MKFKSIVPARLGRSLTLAVLVADSTKASHCRWREHGFVQSLEFLLLYIGHMKPEKHKQKTTKILSSSDRTLLWHQHNRHFLTQADLEKVLTRYPGLLKFGI
jgi:hypothetical protein